jgi:hypothetical protein
VNTTVPTGEMREVVSGYDSANWRDFDHLTALASGGRWEGRDLLEPAMDMVSAVCCDGCGSSHAYAGATS